MLSCSVSLIQIQHVPLSTHSSFVPKHHLIKNLLSKTWIDGGERIIEEINGSIFVNGSRKADPLALAPAQVLTSLLHLRQVALGQPLKVFKKAAATNDLK